MKPERTAKSDKKLYQKQLRTPYDVIEERDRGYGKLTFGGDAVEMFWNMNEHTIRDQIFKLRVKCKCGEYKTVWIDAEDMQRYMRWV